MTKKQNGIYISEPLNVQAVLSKTTFYVPYVAKHSNNYQLSNKVVFCYLAHVFIFNTSGDPKLHKFYNPTKLLTNFDCLRFHHCLAGLWHVNGVNSNMRNLTSCKCPNNC